MLKRGCVKESAIKCRQGTRQPEQRQEWERERATDVLSTRRLGRRQQHQPRSTPALRRFIPNVLHDHTATCHTTPQWTDQSQPPLHSMSRVLSCIVARPTRSAVLDRLTPCTILRNPIFSSSPSANRTNRACSDPSTRIERIASELIHPLTGQPVLFRASTRLHWNLASIQPDVQLRQATHGLGLPPPQPPNPVRIDASRRASRKAPRRGGVNSAAAGKTPVATGGLWATGNRRYS